MPLETFSGWPQVPNPTPLQSLTLLIGIPLLIALIVIAMIEIGARSRAKRGDVADVSDPLWVGARESAQVEAVSDSPEGAQATAKASVPDVTAAGRTCPTRSTPSRRGAAGSPPGRGTPTSS